jgi:hypothetical protein
LSTDKSICAEREGVTGGWLKVLTEKLHNVKFPSNIILIKLRRMILTGFSEILWENHYGRGHFENVSVRRRMILNRILKKEGKMAWSRFIWQRVLVNAIILFGSP